MKELKTTHRFKIRFSEIDVMRVAWHGAYAKYFEDAREQFGREFGLSYQLYIDSGYYAPVVDLNFQYRKPLRYGMEPEITITYRYTPAAKIIFDYEIREYPGGEVMAKGRSVQVFMDMNYELQWTSPEFYDNWKNEWNLE